MRNQRITIIALASLSLALGACGSATVASSAATASRATTVATPAATPGTGASGRGVADQAYVSCMSTNGVTLPARDNRTPAGSTPTTVSGTAAADGSNAGASGTGRFRPGSPTAPPGVDQAVYTKALAACESVLPTGGFGGGGGRLNNPAYVACMKDNGVLLPATPATSVPGATAASDAVPTSPVLPVDRSSATYVAANAKCKVLLPNGGVPTAPADPGTTTTISG